MLACGVSTSRDPTWSAALSPCRNPAAQAASNLRRDGRGTTSLPEEQLAAAREAFEAGTDFTVAVEEEFALLDPDTLLLADRFEELQAAARGTDARASTWSAS